MPVSRSLLTTTSIGITILMICLACGCNSIQDAWETNRVPPQSEPEITDPGENW